MKAKKERSHRFKMLNIASKVQLACEMMNKSFATTEKNMQQNQEIIIKC